MTNPHEEAYAERESEFRDLIARITAGSAVASAADVEKLLGLFLERTTAPLQDEERDLIGDDGFRIEGVRRRMLERNRYEWATQPEDAQHFTIPGSDRAICGWVLPTREPEDGDGAFLVATELLDAVSPKGGVCPTCLVAGNRYIVQEVLAAPEPVQPIDPDALLWEWARHCLAVAEPIRARADLDGFRADERGALPWPTRAAESKR